jgi:hypothetical protein
MDIQWMVITESLGVEEANRWQRARIEQMMGVSSTVDGSLSDSETHSSGIGVWLRGALAALAGRRPHRSAFRAAPQG